MHASEFKAAEDRLPLLLGGNTSGDFKLKHHTCLPLREIPSDEEIFEGASASHLEIEQEGLGDNRQLPAVVRAKFLSSNEA